MKNISRTLLIAFAITLIPSATQAYNTTNQTAVAAANNIALYTVSFELGFQDTDTYVPVLAERTSENNLTNKQMGYTFTTSYGGDILAGDTKALVLSSQGFEVIDGMYKIPAGRMGQFTLVVTLELDNNDVKAKYGLQTTNLPYTRIDSSGNVKEYGLGVPGLFSYKTKQVGLNR